MFATISNFLIDQWLWNVTWDWYHIPLTILFITILFKFFLRINIIASVLIALSSTLASFIAYSLFVVGILMYLFKFTYESTLQGSTIVSDPLHACVYVGIIYAILQSVFFIVLHRYYPLQRVKVMMAAFIANMLAAGTVYLVVNPLM